MSQNPYENNPYDKNPGNGQNQQPQGYQPQNQNSYEQQGAQYQQDPYGQPQPGAVSADDKNMAFLMNLISAGATFLSATTIGFLAPLIFWFVYKDKPGYGFTKEASRRAFNFNFTLWVITMASWILALITFGILIFIPLTVMSLVAIVLIVFHIIAAVSANKGEEYEYPLTFIKILNSSGSGISRLLRVRTPCNVLGAHPSLCPQQMHVPAAKFGDCC